MSVIQYIQSDLYRYCGKCSLLYGVKQYLLNATFRWQVAFRLSQAESVAKYLGMMLWILNGSRRRISIQRSCKVGYGLFIGHGGPVVVNPTAVIGNNCNLSQFVTIGTNHAHAAIIGDNCYIGPNVCIVENVVIGNNVTIGAGSVVTKNIPDDATAAGNYARVLNYKKPGRYIVNRWPENS